MLIRPINQGENLASEIRHAKQNGDTDSFDIWWLGQSGFLIQWNKKCLLFDPYLSDSLTKKYASTHKPHERLSELVIGLKFFRSNSFLPNFFITRKLFWAFYLNIFKKNNASLWLYILKTKINFEFQ